MGTCAHRYRESHTACPYTTVEGSNACLWHDGSVRKDDAYVPALLDSADIHGDGNLDEFQLAGLHWPEAQLQGRSLRHVNLRDAVLDVANFGGTDLAGANLSRASLKRANLQRACLTGADLTACNLTGADLREADLKKCKLNHTVLNSADLRGADLTGATIDGFLWNGRTRFQGIRGIGEPMQAGEDDETRPCLSPMVAGAIAGDDDDSRARSLLEDPDPAREETRAFDAVVIPVHTDESSRPKTNRYTKRRERLLIAATCISLTTAFAGISIILTNPRTAQSTNTAPDPAFTRELHQAQQQLSATTAEVTNLQQQQSELLNARDKAEQRATVARAELARQNDLLRQSQSDAAYLRGADDRLATASTQLTSVESDRAHLAAELVRQQRLGRILAEGAKRLDEQSKIDQAALTDLQSRVERTELMTRELTIAREQISQAKAVAEQQTARAQILNDELARVRDDLDRYLGRVTGTAWQDLLTADENQSPFIPIIADRTVTLGGAYAVTVRIGKGERPQSVATALTIQGNLGSANPDVALVLYDNDHRVLRRLAFGFPSQNDAHPIAAARAEIACDQFPAYARVLVAPSLATAAR